jgi:Uma2 family endonuclease
MLAPPRPLEIPSGQAAGDGLPESFSLPASLCAGLRFTPEQFAELCQANPEAVLELAADGSLILMTPTGSETGARNGELFFQIKAWARASGRWKSFDSSSGFRLPDNSVLSPDAALVALDRWQALSDAERRGFAPLCPDLVVELARPSDAGPRGLTTLRQKMAAYQRNGARLGWLLIPAEQAVEIWGPLADAPPSPGGSKRLPASMEIPSSPAWRWSWKRSGRADYRRSSRFIQLIQSAEICLGQTASHSSWLLQLPKPSAAMRSVIARARR